MINKIRCPKCEAGTLKITKENIHDVPINQCNLCFTKYKIYIDYHPDDGNGVLTFEEAD